MIDVFRAVVDVKPQYRERELRQHCLQHRQQVGLADLARATHHLPLRHRIYRIDVIHALGPIPVALMHRDGAKGVYHINAVDTVTQWQVVGCTSKISEAYLLPVLEAVLAQFPFMILGFHADNGSEYINHRVAGMLDKWHADFTKSRACRSQD